MSGISSICNNIWLNQWKFEINFLNYFPIRYRMCLSQLNSTAILSMNFPFTDQAVKMILLSFVRGRPALSVIKGRIAASTLHPFKCKTGTLILDTQINHTWRVLICLPFFPGDVQLLLLEGDLVSAAAIFSFSEAMLARFTRTADDERIHAGGAPPLITVPTEKYVRQRDRTQGPRKDYG